MNKEIIYPDYFIQEDEKTIQISTTLRKKFGKYYYLTPMITHCLIKTEEDKRETIKNFHKGAYTWMICSKFSKVKDINGVKLFTKDQDQRSEKERLF